MANQTENQALERARNEAINETVSRLRAFTGISGFTPDLKEPEHRAYLAYELELAHGLELWTGHRDARQGEVDRLIVINADARHAMEAERQRRRSERSGGLLSQARGVIQDAAFPEKKQFAATSKVLKDAWASLHAAEDRVREIKSELLRVSTWLEQLFADVEAIRIDRHERENAARLEREYAARDTSPRNFAVFTPEEFVDADARRLARHQGGILVLDGLTYTSGWRRDQDDFATGRGNWMLVWNSATSETFLERVMYGGQPEVWLLGTKIATQDQATEFDESLRPQVNERNSVAVVLDAYTAL